MTDWQDVPEHLRARPAAAALWLSQDHAAAVERERAVRAAGEWRERSHRLADRLDGELRAGAIMRRALRAIAAGDSSAPIEDAVIALIDERQQRLPLTAI